MQRIAGAALGLAYDDAAARQSLADVVVAVAGQLDRHAARQESTEALARGADELHRNRVVGQPRMAGTPRDLAREHGAHRAVDVGDRQLDPDRLAGVERRLRRLDQLVIESLVETVILALAVGDGDARPCRHLVQQLGEIDATRLPMVERAVHVEPVDPAGHFREGAEAQPRHDLAQFLCDEEEVVDHVLGLAGEALAQDRVLRGHAHRAGVEMALAHHDAARRDQGRGREAELVGAQQRADGDVAAGAESTINLNCNTSAQPVQHQRLLRLGEADLPRRARMRQRGQR